MSSFTATIKGLRCVHAPVRSGSCAACSFNEAATSKDTGKAWTFPKAHAMYHATTTVRLYGPLEWSSAETVERRHVEIKEAFTRTNNRKECEVQVLRGEMRIDDSTGGRTRPRDDADGCQTGAGTSEPAQFHHTDSERMDQTTVKVVFFFNKSGFWWWYCTFQVAQSRRMATTP